MNPVALGTSLPRGRTTERSEQGEALWQRDVNQLANLAEELAALRKLGLEESARVDLFV